MSSTSAPSPRRRRWRAAPAITWPTTTDMFTGATIYAPAGASPDDIPRKDAARSTKTSSQKYRYQQPE
jgi:hypothetical protein